MKTGGSKQRYSFDKHDRVLSRGGYQVSKTAEFSSLCLPMNKRVWDLLAITFSKYMIVNVINQKNKPGKQKETRNYQ